MPADDEKMADLLAIAGRIERAQERFVTIADDILTSLEAHTEKLDAILEAATKEPGPSPTARLLKQIVASLNEQSAVLEALPVAFAKTLREEMDRELEEEIDAEGADAWEPAVPDDELPPQ